MTVTLTVKQRGRRNLPQKESISGSCGQHIYFIIDSFSIVPIVPSRYKQPLEIKYRSNNVSSLLCGRELATGSYEPLCSLLTSLCRWSVRRSGRRYGILGAGVASFAGAGVSEHSFEAALMVRLLSILSTQCLLLLLGPAPGVSVGAFLGSSMEVSRVERFVGSAVGASVLVGDSPLGNDSTPERVRRSYWLLLMHGSA